MLTVGDVSSPYGLLSPVMGNVFNRFSWKFSAHVSIVSVRAFDYIDLLNGCDQFDQGVDSPHLAMVCYIASLMGNVSFGFSAQA